MASSSSSVMLCLHNNIPQCSFSLIPPSSNPTKTLLFHLPPKPLLHNPISLTTHCSFSSSIISSPHIHQQEEEEGNNNNKDPSCPPLNQVWRTIQGENNWEGLLEPLNPHLRQEIIRYGELAQACYDSFDFDPQSKYCGTCKYHPSHFFTKLDYTNTYYSITRYLYATSNINLPNFFQKSSLTSVWSPHANWMGYVAVLTDPDEIRRLGRRDIVIAWRGTVTYLEWIYDLKDILRSANFGQDPTVKIESGFYDLYTKKEESCDYCTFSAREQILAEVKRLVEYYGGEEEEISITITGHSLGAAFAILSAYDISEMKLNVVDDQPNKKIPVTVYSFAGPRVGNLKFKVPIYTYYPPTTIIFHYSLYILG